MSAYAAGLDAVGQLGTFAMPAAQAERIREIARGVASLRAAVDGYQPAPSQAAPWQAWKAQFDAFASDWDRFAEETDFADRMWGSTANQIESYATALAAWRSSFEAWGGRVIAPGLTTESTSRARDNFAAIGKGVAIGVVVSLVTAGVLALLRGTR